MACEQCNLEMRDGSRLIGDTYVPDRLMDKLGVVIVVHGMAEHRKRYKNFANFLIKKGYVVFCYDQRGHGETAGSLEKVGYIGDSDNFKTLVDDCRMMVDHIKGVYPDLPIFLLGHSMGSFVVQSYIEQYSKTINGAILSGSNYLKSPLFGFGRFLAGSIVTFKGKKYRSTFLDKMSFGAYNKPFRPNRTNFDWLSANEANVDRYIADDYCGGLFTASYFRDLLKGFKDIMKHGKNIRPDLPILIASGEMDPVSNLSRNIPKLEQWYIDNGIKDVEVKLYEGKRHEILNEDNREEVAADMLNWLQKHNHVKPREFLFQFD